MNVLPMHVVLKIKRKSDGTVERFKARIVARGSYQTYGEDYFETYAPVVSFPLVGIFLYLLLCLNMVVGQLNVKTAFLNGELNEDVWVVDVRLQYGAQRSCQRVKMWLHVSRHIENGLANHSLIFSLVSLYYFTLGSYVYNCAQWQRRTPPA